MAELTICVCDNCKTRLEIDPDKEPHGHGIGGRRIPRGWTVLESIFVPLKREEPKRPRVEPDTSAMRPHAVKVLEGMLDALKDPATTDEAARYMVRRYAEELAPYDGPVDLHEHVIPKHEAALFCGACKPIIVREKDGAVMQLIEPRGYGPYGMVGAARQTASAEAE